MRHLRKPGLAALVLVAAWCLAGPARAEGLKQDPVEQLRQALRQNRAVVADLANKLTSPGDLRRALMLREWGTGSLDPAVRQQDQQIWNRLADRFAVELKKALASDDPLRQLAAANLLAEMATAVQSSPLESALVQGRLSSFGKPLADLIGQGADPRVREAAIRALGRVNPDSKVAAPALERVLFGTPESSLADRRAAAEALANLIRGVAQSEKGTRADIRSVRDALSRVRRDTTATPDDLKAAEDRLKNLRDQRKALVQGTVLYVDEAGRALSDGDTEVRRLAMEAFQQAGIGLSEVDFPAPEPNETDEEYQKEFEGEWNTLLPLMDELRKQSGALARAINDPDPSVRTMARRAAENLAYARAKLLHPSAFMAPTPLPPPGPPSMGKEESRLPAAGPRDVAATAAADPPKQDPLRQGLRQVLDALAAGLTDKDVLARLAAVDAIEALGKDAVPVAPALVRALADCNLFMRWAAARTLGEIGPVAVAQAVPGLVRLLGDQDLDVRLTALQALGRFGPAAVDAAPALARAVTTGDVELRTAAIAALEGIGTDAAGAAIPALTQALAASDPRLQRAAAHSLARYADAGIDLGSAATAALQRALNDPDPDVRRLASDALLSAGSRREKK